MEPMRLLVTDAAAQPPRQATAWLIMTLGRIIKTMSVDNYKTEHHLTSNGWVYGSSWFYDKLQGEEKQRPQDTVETWLRHETQSSAYSRPDVEWSVVWTNPAVSEAEIAKLRAKYPLNQK
jgi:hypothetical protein